ncbi:hypothetical protein Cni_G07477 [Canna indica]|uniref:Uncharacterized protein n=1 Tax=Canna indica TaxID=4628 RepID=A0AAQ3K412_9LILI|nr:hypothetical protein Cni_G07477 [Canna indica]
MMEQKVESSPRRSSGKLRRQPSRLQMHAPSFIRVAPPSIATAAQWSVDAIPLLSPLDVDVAVPWAEAGAQSSGEEASPSSGEEEHVKRDGGGGTLWRHPAMPFHYEAAATAGKAPVPAFLLPHCT